MTSKIKYDLAGKKFGRLTVIGLSQSKDKSGRSLWDCVCECGNKCSVASHALRTGGTVSCGCKRKTHNILAHQAVTTHGLSKTRIYKEWTRMIQRCRKDGKCKDYWRYRELGISVCNEWKKDFTAFYKWSMENGYRDDLTIDRIDLYVNYEPSNCRWATMKQQLNNTRQNRHYTHDGVTHTLTEWQDITGIPAQRIKYRVNKGWPKELIFDPGNHQKNRVIGRKNNE